MIRARSRQGSCRATRRRSGADADQELAGFGAIMSQTIHFDGGSDADRAQVIEALHAYLEANATFDWRALGRIWRHDETSVFFNMNGHTYVGLDQWTRLWQYYSERVDTGWWEPYDINVLIRGDMAL